MRNVTLSIAALIICQNPALAQKASKPATLNIIVANQQAASASLLTSDGASAKHLQVGTGPHEAAVSADGRIAVLTIYGAQVPGNQLAIVDLERDSLIRTIDLGTYTRPHGAVFLSDSPRRIAVTSETTGNVVIVNIDSGQVEAAVPTTQRASHMLAVTADKKRGYTANIVDNSVSELDLAAQKFVRTFDVPARPEGIAVTPDGKEVWVGSNQTGAVTVIQTSTGAVTHTLTGAVMPYRLGSAPSGKFMAIVDAQANKVHFADVATHQITGAVELQNPRGVFIGPDSRTSYITLAEGAVAIVDVTELKVLRTIPVQASPDGIAVSVRR